MFRQLMGGVARTFAVLLVAAAPSYAKTEPSSSDIDVVFDKFVEHPDHGPMVFDTQKAREEGVGEEILEIGDSFNDIAYEKWVVEERPATTNRAPLVDRWS